MTRQEVEVEIYGRMREIVEICKEYDENLVYLNLCYNDGKIHFNNRYWETEKKINFREKEVKESE